MLNEPFLKNDCSTLHNILDPIEQSNQIVD